MPRRGPPPLLLALVPLLTLAASCERGPDLATTLRIDGADVRSTDDRTVVRVAGRFTGDTIIATCDQPIDEQAFRTHPEEGAWIPLERADADRLYPLARGTLPTLPPGTTCDVRLQRNGETLERQSDEASTTITLDPDVPLAPTHLAVTPSDATLHIAFDAPNDNGAIIRNYAYTFDDPLDANAAWTPLSPSDATPPITVTDLRNGVTYHVALRALNDAGAGRASAPITATPFTTPSAPRNVTIEPGDARLTVSFTPPSDNGAPITNYAYRADAPGHTGTWTPRTPADPTPPLTLTGLRNDTRYTVTLRAINRAGSGAPSAPATATPTAPTPPDPPAPPDPPEPEPDAPSIAGSDHSLAPDADGTLWTWGHNPHGQLGNGTTVASTTPVSVTDVAERGVRITGVAAGTNHSVALDEHGTIWTWGKNEYGQLGTGTNVDSATPVSVSDLPSPDTPMTHVAAGPFRTFALDRDGHLWAWGYGPNGSVGTGTSGTFILTPVSLTDGTWPGPGVSITDVAAGGSFSLALDTTGTVWAWGANKGGQLGTGGAYGESLAKVSVTDLAAAGARITQIAAGDAHALALDADGTVWAWGTGFQGQLGNGETALRTTPISVTDWPGGPVRITDVAAGRVHSLALDVQGRLWAWGYNAYGQLGDGTTDQRTTPVRVSVTDASGEGVSITDLAAGTYHSLARDRDGHLWAWGRNDKGQRGDGTTEASSVPGRVPLP